MKRTLLYILLCTNVFLFAQQTYVPDDNFEAYLEANNMGNGIANDNYVTTANIANVTTIDLDGQNIADATGIEDFVSIINLFFDNNQITTIDLSANTALSNFSIASNSLDNIDFTNNVLLYDLDVSNNSLTSINLSNNAALLYLYISNNLLTDLNIDNSTLLLSIVVDDNQLTSIDVSNSISLSGITASNNSLATIDLALNTSLYQIDVRNNLLTSMNIKNAGNTNLSIASQFKASNNPNLICIQVDDVAYSTTNWTTIDAQTSFSQYCSVTYVPDDNFENYLETHDASGNVVTVGDAASMGNGIANDDYVSTEKIETVASLSISNKSIADMTGIEDFIALQDLNCQFNDLVSLDLSNNLALTTLRADTNNITTIDLSNNSNLTYFQAVNNDLEYLNIRNGNNSNVTTFYSNNNSNLTCINVDDDTASYLATWGKDATASFSIHCDETYVPDDNFENYLETHDTSGTIVAIGDVTSMGNGIANDDYVTTTNISSVVSLSISNKSIADMTGIEAFIALETLIAPLNIFTTLNLSNNVNLKTLMCSYNLSLTSINISANSLLESITCGETAIGSLDLSGNPQLIDLSCDSTQITILDVSNNTMLETIFAVNNNLSTLDLSMNPKLINVFIPSTSLTELNIKNGTNTNIVSFVVTITLT